MNYTLSAGIGSFTLVGRAYFTYNPTTLKAHGGTFELGSNPTILTKQYVMPAATGVFSLYKIFAGLNYTGQAITLRDELAAEAPAVPDTFVPVMINGTPAVVLSPADYIAATYASTSQEAILFNQYYDTVNKTWDDAAYQDANPGQEIPVTLKQIVGAQQYNYDVYVSLLASWTVQYNFEKIFQWPYYWADQLLARRSF